MSEKHVFNDRKQAHVSEQSYESNMAQSLEPLTGEGREEKGVLRGAENFSPPKTENFGTCAWNRFSPPDAHVCVGASVPLCFWT